MKVILSVALNKGSLKNGTGQRKWKTERRSKTSKTRKPEIQGKLSMIIEKKMINEQ